MKIRLIGDLHPELTSIGLKVNDEVFAQKCPVSKVGAVHFQVKKGDHTYNCTVWTENYEIIKPQ